MERHKAAHWTEENIARFSPEGRGFPQRPDISLQLENCWFRGQTQDWPLLPKVYRKSYQEMAMLLDARRKGAILPGARPQEDLIGWYFLLQHHGFAMRLLDWTESALVGLYFACSEIAKYKGSGLLRRFKPTVWMIQPNAFNWAFRSGSIVAGTGRDEATYNAQEGFDYEWGKDNIVYAWSLGGGPRPPVALTGAYVDRRIQAQRSRFTCHGSDRNDLRSEMTRMGMIDCGLAVAFRISAGKAFSILKELHHLGISRGVLFPDLDGLSQEYDELADG